MCNCIEEIDKALEGTNTKLEVCFNLFGGPTTMLVATTKRDDKKREKPSLFVPTYCPSCGEKYPGAEGVKVMDNE